MKTIGFLVIMFLVSSCVVIPKETVKLSQILGNDLQVLHNAHRNMVSIHYTKIMDEINIFVNDVYAPFIINYMLKSDLSSYKAGGTSLFGAMELAGQKATKEETEEALNEMSDFLGAVRSQVETKRSELILPISNQESQVLLAVDQSYEHAIYANSTITGYLQSIRKVKATQEEALSLIGIPGADTLMTNSLVRLSDHVKAVLEKAKAIDTKSDDAYNKLDAIIKEIKNVTNKK